MGPPSHHPTTTTTATPPPQHARKLPTNTLSSPFPNSKQAGDYFLQGKPSSKRLPQLGDHPASSSSSLLRLGPAQPLAAMVASALFIMDLKGKIIISRNYRGDIPLTVSER